MNASTMVMATTEQSTKQNLPILTEDGNVNLNAISPSDMEKYKRIGKDLICSDINSVAKYGSELQDVMNKSSSEMLNAVRAPKCGEIGDLITNLLSELEYVDVEELKEPSLVGKVARRIPIVNKFMTSVKKVLHKYDSITQNVESIAQKIAVTRVAALKDNTSLQLLFMSNKEYCKQIEDLIIAGTIKINEMRSNIGEMLANPSQYDSHEIKDMEEYCNNLERRIHDLVVLRHVMSQSLFQIRTVQYNNLRIADKAQSIISTTLPLWRNQLSIAIALNSQRNNIEAQRKVCDATNTILKKNAEMLHYTSVAVAKENERSVVDVETFRESTQKLIDTVKEVQQIAIDGHSKREAAIKEIIAIEQNLETNIKTMAAQIGKNPNALLTDDFKSNTL